MGVVVVAAVAVAVQYVCNGEDGKGVTSILDLPRHSSTNHQTNAKSVYLHVKVHR